MSQPSVRADLSKIDTTVKEAVVDALINLTFAQISGGGADGEVVYGARPRMLFNSAFLLPKPPDAVPGDEVSRPIHLFSHGLDFQVRRDVAGDICVKPTLAVYVRILPSVEDLKRSDCQPQFRLNDDTRKALMLARKAALAERWATEQAKGGYKRRYEHPDWPEIEREVVDGVYAKLGLPKDLSLLLSGEGAEEVAGEPMATDGAGPDAGAAVKPDAGFTGKDEHFKPMVVPHKWMRIPLDASRIPEWRFSASLDGEQLKTSAAIASQDLSGALGEMIREWADSEFGKLWCYRKGVSVYPSQYRSWAKFLDGIRNSDRKLALPDIQLSWMARVSPDWLQPDRSSVHLSLENISETPKTDADATDESVFQIHLDVELPKPLHAALKLGRVKPSYRYNQFLDYPATGFNGGVALRANGGAESVHLQTTWAPRYVQPRIIPRSYPGIDRNIRALSRPDGLLGLKGVLPALETWFQELPQKVDPSAGLAKDDANGIASEQRKFNEDRANWRKEIDAVAAGLRVLTESHAAWTKTAVRGQQSDPKAYIYEAWLGMNEAMADLMKLRTKDDSGEWRLFQLAFVLANVAGVASREPAFQDEFSRERDDTVTLLYFATGGGKSEAFFGLLVLSLFFDRLRGKRLGVTAMLRYPLRLLTIQQAQRCSKVLACAELVRRRTKIDGEPFSIGFWVGSSGSPNNPKSPGMDYIPSISKFSPDPDVEHSLSQDDANYRAQKAAWNKIPSCPFCGSETALRLFDGERKGEGGTLGHVCTKHDCPSHVGGWSPLPFYILDTDIYDFAPSVLLGTVDKLALIGQSSRTLRRIYGMFGAAPWRHVQTGRVVMPTEPLKMKGGPEGAGCVGLFPAYEDGEKAFHDPFPGLLIQDEAHLLDESLGTFAGLFESALDAVFGAMSAPLGRIVCYEPDGQTRRRTKVIAASATVSEPQRQLEHLYQRPVPAMQFPYPGQSLYESFYAEPAAPDASEVERAKFKVDSVEAWARWARVYVAFMTNGKPHTTTTTAILSSFHTVISTLLLALTGPDPEKAKLAREQLVDAISPGALRELYKARIEVRSDSELATVIDLHRIALTYVTNKKGGDQIMAAEFEETRKRHAAKGLPIADLKTRLITGSVSQGEIQKTVEEAQARPAAGMPFEDLQSSLRSVIATSAVSHGVDVEELNAMFFAGMPSDIAEYIQASSRVGRTHVGFVVLIPTPQRRRDRYIIEVFDSFHRFLERMVQPAAIDRWAEKAVERVLPSIIQAYLTGVVYVKELTVAPPDEKERVSDLSWIPNISARYKKQQKPFTDGLCAFIARAIGLDSEDFSPKGRDDYERMIFECVRKLLDLWAHDKLQGDRSLTVYFNDQASVMDRPMTSLRDVDEAGEIRFSGMDLNGRRLTGADAKKVMDFIRSGVAEGAEAREDKNEA
jgi:hypothetical protein